MLELRKLLTLKMLLTHLVLGILFALGGQMFAHIMGRQWGLLLGPVLILLGLVWIGWLPLNIPGLSLRAKKMSGLWGAFLLGIPFTVALCPACAPALLITLTASAGSGSVWFGAVLLLAFGLGRVIPIMIGVLAISWLTTFHHMAAYYRWIEISGGITLVLTGLYLIDQSIQISKFMGL